MKITILTLFPGMFEPILGESMIGRAVENKILEFEIIDIRDHTLDKHKSVDDTPYGGGAGMIMATQPLFYALNSVNAKSCKTIYMSPRGKVMDKEMIDSLAADTTAATAAATDEIIIICGHYEGIDQRVLDHFDIEEVSIGDYILTGGELPAMVLIDSVARMIPGVIGSKDSHNEESIYSGLLEYPQYTKPEEYEGMKVPEVLVSGHHKKISLWNFEQSLRLTAERRPDLFKKFIASNRDFTKEEKALIEQVKHDYNFITED